MSPASKSKHETTDYDDLLDSIFADLDETTLDSLSRPAVPTAVKVTKAVQTPRNPLSTIRANTSQTLARPQGGKASSRQALSPRKPQNTATFTTTRDDSRTLKSSTSQHIQQKLINSSASAIPLARTSTASTSAASKAYKRNAPSNGNNSRDNAAPARAGSIAVKHGPTDAELLDGIEWSDDDLNASSTVEVQIARSDKGKGVDKTAIDARSAELALERSQPGYIPHSKRYTRCTVLTVTEKVVRDFRREKTLIVEVERSKECRRLLLFDEWATTNVEKGDVVNVIGDFHVADPLHETICSTSQQALHEDLPTCTFSYSSNNLLIVHPDTLISATRATDAHTCARKAVVQEKIRSSGDNTAALVYGNLLHEVFQSCLLAVAESKTSNKSLEERISDAFCISRREEEIDRLLKIPKHIESLFTISVELDEARTQLRERSVGYADFAKQYMGEYPHADAYLSDPRKRNDDLSNAARLSISAVHDIEEDVWSPRLGLKGKIDASVQVCLVGPKSPAWPLGQEERSVIPFEIKTGKSFSVMQHRAQTMLYTQMMADRYDRIIDSGLLYYTQGNSLTKVEPIRNELRGLLIARNEMARYLTPPPQELGDTSADIGLADVTSVSCTQSQAHAEPDAHKDTVEMEEDSLWADIEDLTGLPNLPTEHAKTDARPVLPPPLDDAKVCKKCYAADACMVYRRALDGTRFIGSDEDPLQQNYDDRVGHLNDTHAEFFRTWERLISFEERELLRSKKEIWLSSADQRERLGRCFANMILDQNFAPESYRVKTTSSHRYIYRLVRATAAPDRLSTQVLAHTQLSQASADTPILGPLNSGQMSVGDPVVVSLEPSVLALARGYILEMRQDYIELGLDHSLATLPGESAAITRRAGGQFVFRVDKDELQAGLGRLRENLGQLFYANGDEKRRRIVVELEQPRFNDPDYRPLEERETKASNVNADQYRAIDTVLRAQDYALILGMPGTGKTTTIASIIIALAARGKSVLLTSYTHSAVDNILLKVKDSDVSMLRLGQLNRVMPSLAHLTLSAQDAATSIAQLEQRLFSPQVVATTALGIDHAIFSRRKFDYCIVDEASQITLPACLGPLRFADRFILVGDHNQLPPLVKNVHARKGGYDMSLFRRLSESHPEAVVNLTHQYRMNADIMSISNRLVYGNSLVCGTNELANKLMSLPHSKVPLCQVTDKYTWPHWLQDLSDPARTVIFADTDAMPAREERLGRLVQNEAEARLLVKTTEALLQQGFSGEQIGVIALYRQQIQLLESLLTHHKGVEILTADRSQGRDKDCILMSLTRSNASQQVGDLLKDWRRLNVCFTRARFKLVMFGSRSTLAEIPHMAHFFELADEKDWVYTLPPDALQTHDSLVAFAHISASSIGEPANEQGGTDPVKPHSSYSKNPINSQQHQWHKAEKEVQHSVTLCPLSVLGRRAPDDLSASDQLTASPSKKIRPALKPLSGPKHGVNAFRNKQATYKERPILRDILNSQ